VQETVRIAQINFQNWHHSEMEKLVDKYEKERDEQKQKLQELAELLKNRPVKATPQAYERWIKDFEKRFEELLKP
jgi:lysyl-tRNA synthetase class II